LRLRFGDDFRRVFARYVGPEIVLSPGATSRTPFGVERVGLGYGQPTFHPLAGASLRDVHAYAWPDPAWMDVSHIRAEAEGFARQYAILGGDWSPFWHDLIDLLGMEEMYLKMYDEPALVDAILAHVVMLRSANGYSRQPARRSTSSSSVTTLAASRGRCCRSPCFGGSFCRTWRG